jgi:hypothetical protein
MIFKSWIILQAKRDDPVGDLARDVLQNRTWPPAQEIVKLRKYLVKRGAVENALLALDPNLRVVPETG